MKFFCFVCVTVTLCVSAFGMSNEEFMDTRVQMMKGYMTDRMEIQKMKTKFENFCPGKGNKLMEALTKVQECAELIEKSEETMCSTIKNHLEICSKPVVVLVEDCLPEKSKELPSFLIKTVVSMTNHACKTDGEHIFEFSNPCVMSDSYRVRRCILKTRSRLEQYSNKTPTKSEICEFLKSMRQCFKTHLELSCGNSITREAFMGLFDSALTQCEEYPTIEYGFKVADNEVEMVE